MATVNSGVETPITENNGGTIVNTPITENNGGTVETPITENNGGNNEHPFKVFTTQEEFDNHSAGIMRNAQQKVEKEILHMLGLNPNEKDKLAKFKELYESSLTEAEKNAKKMEELSTSVSTLTAQVKEKDAIIAALSKVSGKGVDDVSKLVRMARGLVTEDVTIEQALEEVLSYTKKDTPKTPVGTPPPQNTSTPEEANPFKTGNITEQGKLFKADIEKAREAYFVAYGKHPSW